MQLFGSAGLTAVVLLLAVRLLLANGPTMAPNPFDPPSDPPKERVHATPPPRKTEPARPAKTTPANPSPTH